MSNMNTAHVGLRILVSLIAAIVWLRVALRFNAAAAYRAGLLSAILRYEDWEWRLEVYKSVSYWVMVAKFWKPLESFYPNKSFLFPLATLKLKEMTFDYRLFCQDTPKAAPSGGEHGYFVAECYYDEKGTPELHSTMDHDLLYGSSVEDVEETYDMIGEAFAAPVIFLDEEGNFKKKA